MKINEFLGKILSIDPNFITIIVFVACFLLAVGCCFPKKYWCLRLRDVAPALMVSAGIIGTFWGTLIALANFQTGGSRGSLDHEAMVESIPAVLGGMKVAFITTLIGLLSAFILKFALRVFTQAEHKPLPIEENTIDLLKQIKDGLVGENESSIASQLINLRNESGNNFNKLDKRMEGLADAIRHSLVENMEALMKNLREVIVEQLAKQLKETNELLRKKMSEMLIRIEDALINQFGETFKQFNEATQAIKKWQEDHRQHVEQLTQAFDVAAKGIEKIRSDCESIPATMEQLKKLMGELDERLQAFADMKKSAEQSFPVIKKHLDAIGADLEKSASGFSELENIIKETQKQAGELAQQHIEIAQRHVGEVNKQMEHSAKQVAEKAKNMITESRNASIQYQTHIRTMVDAVTEESNKCVKQTQTTLTEMATRHAETINGAMEGIAKRWGEIMLGIAEEMAQTIESRRQ